MVETVERDYYPKLLPIVLDEKYGGVDQDWIAVAEAGDVLGKLNELQARVPELLATLADRRMSFHPKDKHDQCSDMHILPAELPVALRERCATMLNQRKDAGEAFWAHHLIAAATAEQQLPNPPQSWTEAGRQLIHTYHNDWLHENGEDKPKLDDDLWGLLGAALEHGKPEAIHLHGYQKRYVDYLFLISEQEGLREYKHILGLLCYANIRNEQHLVDVAPEVTQIENNPQLLSDPHWQAQMRKITEQAFAMRAAKKEAEANHEIIDSHEERGRQLGHFATLALLPGHETTRNQLKRNIPQAKYNLDTAGHEQLVNDGLTIGMQDAFAEILTGEHSDKVTLADIAEVFFDWHGIADAPFDDFQRRVTTVGDIDVLTSQEIAYILVSDFVAEIGEKVGIPSPIIGNHALAAELKARGLRVMNLEIVEGSHRTADDAGYHLIVNQTTGDIDLCPDHATELDYQITEANAELAEVLAIAPSKQVDPEFVRPAIDDLPMRERIVASEPVDEKDIRLDLGSSLINGETGSQRISNSGRNEAAAQRPALSFAKSTTFRRDTVRQNGSSRSQSPQSMSRNANEGHSSTNSNGITWDSRGSQVKNSRSGDFTGPRSRRNTEPSRQPKNNTSNGLRTSRTPAFSEFPDTGRIPTTYFGSPPQAANTMSTNTPIAKSESKVAETGARLRDALQARSSADQYIEPEYLRADEASQAGTQAHTSSQGSRQRLSMADATSNTGKIANQTSSEATHRATQARRTARPSAATTASAQSIGLSRLPEENQQFDPLADTMQLQQFTNQIASANLAQ